jgi:Tol biopolymer transport system component
MIAAALVLVVVIGNGGEQVAERQDIQQAVVIEEATGQAAERPGDDVQSEELEPAREGAPALSTDDSLEPSPTATVEPTATEPPPSVTPAPTVTAMPSPTVTSEPDEPPAADEPAGDFEGRIAVVDNRARLWTVAADGSDIRLLSEQGYGYQFPSWSPNGNDIAVIGSDFEGGGVYVVPDVQDGEMRQLYADSIARPIYLYWSPDGSQVSFIASHPDGLALYLAPEDGADASEVVTTSPSTLFWDWMPDGSQVLVHTGFTALQSDNTRLAFVPLEGTGEGEVIRQRGYFQAPALTSDGRYFSYSDVDPAGNRWLSVRDIKRDQQVELAYHRGVVAMGFSPTGPQLAYTSPENPEDSFYGPLRLIDLDSGDSRQLVAETVLGFFWSPDGRSIAYLTLETVQRPFEFDDAPAASLPGDPLVAEPAVLAKQTVLAKVQSQDDEGLRIGLGLSVIDVESGEATLLTVFEPSRVFLNQFLPFFDQYALSHRLWSPDSNALVMPMEDTEGRNFIVVVPVDGSEPRAIAPGVAAFWSQQ